MSPGELRQLAPFLSPVTLERDQTLAAALKPVRKLYFVESGLVSIVTTLQNGRTVEVAVVGREGIVGIPTLLGTSSMPNRAFVQIPGSAFSLEKNEAWPRLQRKGKLREKALHYLQGYLVQASQTAACNRLHEISERLARWLLLCHDRLDGDEIDITQKTLSDMLGAPRATVTLAVGTLNRGGSIRNVKGRLIVVDRAALEKEACECYGAIRNEYRRLDLL